jgi:hypothetical protein
MPQIKQFASEPDDLCNKSSRGRRSGAARKAAPQLMLARALPAAPNAVCEFQEALRTRERWDKTGLDTISSQCDASRSVICVENVDMRRWRILCCATALVGAVPECAAAASNVELTVSSPFRRADGKSS